MLAITRMDYKKADADVPEMQVPALVLSEMVLIQGASPHIFMVTDLGEVRYFFTASVRPRTWSFS